MGPGTSCKGQLPNTNFQPGFVIAGGGFLSLIKFEVVIRDSDFKKQLSS